MLSPESIDYVYQKSIELGIAIKDMTNTSNLKILTQ